MVSKPPSRPGGTWFSRGALALLLGWVVCTGSVHAVVRTVDDNPGADFSTVQAAINASSGGDTVMVSCGLYEEHIVMKDQVTVLGAGAGCTFLDGGLTGRVVTFSGVTAGTELSGFTIRNGVSNQGGGVFLDNSDPTISRNVISGNSAVQDGGGFLGYGGGLSAVSSSPVITSNLFVGNSSERVGAAIDTYLSTATVVNNTLVGNDVTQPGGTGVGGGIYALYSTLTVTSNIITANTAEGGGGGMDLFESSYTVEHNSLFGNSPADWNCLTTSGDCAAAAFPPGPGNVSTDPLLEDLAAPTSRCPRSHSPAIDAGAPAMPPDLIDLRGRPRVQDGDFNGITVVDMGHCESDEISGLRFVDDDDLTWDPGRPGVLYNLYRGLLSELRLSCATSCAHSQDTGAIIEAEQSCSLGSPSRFDADTPAAGATYYYLVTGENLIEGGLGWRGTTPRNHAHPCP